MKILLALLAALAVLVAPSTAAAAAPGATTGAATDISNGSATLNGVVNPNKEETTYSFEYGTTIAYGSVTPDQPPVSGNAGKEVSVTISGLLANTTYHFRLVAKNAKGTDAGNDATFTTGTSPYTLPANGVTIAAAPNPVTFGKATVVSGTVTGPNAAGVVVDLEQTPSPFTAPFTKTGQTATTDATGNYTFTVTPTANVRYQVTAKTSPPVTSANVQVNVRKRVSFRVNDRSIHRGQRVRFFGTVKPAHDGLVARIQRRKAGKWRTVAKTTLRKSTTAGQSRYSKRMRVYRTGVYRVRVPADADHLRGTSRKRKITVG